MQSLMGDALGLLVALALLALLSLAARALRLRSLRRTAASSPGRAPSSPRRASPVAAASSASPLAGSRPRIKSPTLAHSSSMFDRVQTQLPLQVVARDRSGGGSASASDRSTSDTVRSSRPTSPLAMAAATTATKTASPRRRASSATWNYFARPLGALLHRGSNKNG